MIKHIFTLIGLLSTTVSPVTIAIVNAPQNQIGIVDNVATATSTVLEAVKATNRTIIVWVTAYSSTPEETDETPFITASGKKVEDGIIATNLLPFGTRLKIPEFFGEKIFIVEDRMHARKSNFIDIWMPSKTAAAEFGINYTQVVVLD